VKDPLAVQVVVALLVAVGVGVKLREGPVGERKWVAVPDPEQLLVAVWLTDRVSVALTVRRSVRVGADIVSE